jgi:hypothetical protein
MDVDDCRAWDLNSVSGSDDDQYDHPYDDEHDLLDPSGVVASAYAPAPVNAVAATHALAPAVAVAHAPVPPPAAARALAPLPAGPQFVPVSLRGLNPDDPEDWVAHGWMAEPGAKRESQHVLPPTKEPKRKRRAPDAAAAAAAVAATAALVVGARVEARYLASYGIEVKTMKTYFYPGIIIAVNADGTYDVQYVRSPSPSRRAPRAAVGRSPPPPVGPDDVALTMTT